MNIELRKIDNSNRDICISMQVSPEQMKYIASNENSLKEAQKHSEVARPFLIYADVQPIGFAMFAFDLCNEDPDDRYWLWRFMIDAPLQGKGFGRAAMGEIIDHFSKCGADTITLSTKESNTTALSLYHSFGFLENGQMNDDEIVLKLA